MPGSPIKASSRSGVFTPTACAASPAADPGTNHPRDRWPAATVRHSSGPIRPSQTMPASARRPWIHRHRSRWVRSGPHYSAPRQRQLTVSWSHPFSSRCAARVGVGDPRMRGARALASHRLDRLRCTADHAPLDQERRLVGDRTGPRRTPLWAHQSTNDGHLGLICGATISIDRTSHRNVHCHVAERSENIGNGLDRDQYRQRRDRHAHRHGDRRDRAEKADLSR